MYFTVSTLQQQRKYPERVGNLQHWRSRTWLDKAQSNVLWFQSQIFFVQEIRPGEVKRFLSIQIILVCVSHPLGPLIWALALVKMILKRCSNYIRNQQNRPIKHLRLWNRAKIWRTTVSLHSSLLTLGTFIRSVATQSEPFWITLYLTIAEERN